MAYHLLQLPDPPVLGLITDFGTKDGYPGVIKGIVLSISPRAQIVDISHEISPQAIDEAAFVLFHAYKYFPKGTLFTVVVDPGVGTDRKIIGVTTENYAFLAPDNGVLSAIFTFESKYKVFEIMEKRFFLPEISATFHGRDIFAPVSGQFLNGLTFSEMGEEAQTYHSGQVSKAVVSDDKISGKIIYVDRFGNLISNIFMKDVLEFASKKSVFIRVGKYQIKGLSQTFQTEGGTSLQAYPDSSGFLGFSIFRKNAAAETGLQKGDLAEVFGV